MRLPSFSILILLGFIFLACDNSYIRTKYKHAPIISSSTIKCPNCGHEKLEPLPTDVCLIKYTCENCETVLYPKDGDCCVFCTHGDHKCPSKQ